MYLKRIAFVILIILIGRSVDAQSFNKAKLDSLMDAAAGSNKGMGSLAISKDGQVIYQRAVGYSLYTATQKTPADAKTKYRIGSISKMFTASMVFQLIEEGKLSLSTTLDKFYPQLPNAAKITIGMMLQHRTGLHNFTNDPDYVKYLSQPQTQQQMLARFTTQKPDFEPDTKADYSNTNFVLLGYIVEKLTKTTYAEALKRRVVAKAGLTDSYYGGKISAANHEAQSYKYIDYKWQPDTETDMSIPGGAGAIVSTPTDLDKFIEALFAGKIVSKTSLALMQTIKDNFGMGMLATPASGHKGYGHTGGIDGFGSQVIYFPDDKMSVAYIQNGDTGVMGDVLSGAIQICFNQKYTIPSFKTVQVNDAELTKYTGVYTSTATPLKITISKAGQSLTAQATGQGAFPLRATSATVFEFSAGGIVIEFDAAKNQMTIKQGGKATLFTKNTAAPPLKTEELDKYLGVYASAGFPLKITVTKNNTTLMAQATGQGAFSVEPIAPNVFEFSMAGIVMEFDTAKSEMTLKQAGRTTVFTKEK